MRHSSEHDVETFIHVPESVVSDVEVTVQPVGDNHYTFTPFPFNGDKLEVHCEGRYFEAISPASKPDNMGEAFYSLPTERQSFVFVQ